ncbi:MAG: LysR family transcriptional regulator [Paracoccaceae bacterium]
MEARRLRLFLVLADELNFRRAAERTGVTQSVLSAQVRRLADELGAALFARTTRTVRLTPFGVAFRPEAEAAIARLDHARLAARRFAEGAERTLRLGLTAVFALSPAMDAVAAFRRAHPGVDLVVREAGTVEAEAALARGDIDLALLHPPLDRTDLSVSPLASEPLDAVFAPDAFALSAEPALDEVLAHPLVWHPRRRAPRLSDALVAAARDAGRAPRVVAEAETFLAALALAAVGVGVALLPRPLARLREGALARRAIRGVPLALGCAVALREERADDPLLTALSRCLVDAS